MEAVKMSATFIIMIVLVVVMAVILTWFLVSEYFLSTEAREQPEDGSIYRLYKEYISVNCSIGTSK
jgi:uncharacterized ion transporter superfamily protein YfcC